MQQVQKPDADIAIHLIDGSIDDAYFDYMDLFNTHQITSPINCATNTILDDFACMVRKKYSYTEPPCDDCYKLDIFGAPIGTFPFSFYHKAKHYADNELKNELSLMIFGIEHPLRQLITYLEKTFPRATIVAYLHSSADDYLAYIKQHNLPYPDVISNDSELSTDWFAQQRGETIGYQGSYTKFCVQVLQKKLSCTNIWLTNKPDNIVAQLCSISLQPQVNSLQIEELTDGVANIKTTAYLQIHDIPSASFLGINKLKAMLLN